MSSNTDDAPKTPKNRRTVVVIAVVVAVVVVACLVWLFSGAGAGGTDPVEQAEETIEAGAAAQTVTVSQDAGGRTQEVTVAEGATVLDVLENSGVPFETENGPYGAYVTSIDGKGADGAEGWSYTVNGERPTTGADQCTVADGDQVVWTYGTSE